MYLYLTYIINIINVINIIINTIKKIQGAGVAEKTDVLPPGPAQRPSKPQTRASQDP